MLEPDPSYAQTHADSVAGDSAADSNSTAKDNMTYTQLTVDSDSCQSASTEASAAINGADNEQKYLVIKGETNSGTKFRPSDWCDRLHSTLRVLGDKAEEAGDCVSIINYQGKKCLLLDPKMEEIDDRVYRFFLRFAEDNNLVTENISRRYWESLHTPNSH